jgi:acyl carrier protein
MDLNEFVAQFAEQFDDTEVSEITPDCEFHELDEWSSLTGMSVIALVKTSMGKTITGKDLRECDTVEELFNLIQSK